MSSAIFGGVGLVVNLSACRYLAENIYYGWCSAVDVFLKEHQHRAKMAMKVNVVARSTVCSFLKHNADNNNALQLSAHDEPAPSVLCDRSIRNVLRKTNGTAPYW